MRNWPRLGSNSAETWPTQLIRIQMRILVTGSREFDDFYTVCFAFAVLCEEFAVFDGVDWDLSEWTVVHGDADGADQLADEWAVVNFVDTDPNPADWEAPCTEDCYHRPRKRKDGTPYCPVAGNRRNQVMVDKGADVCLAFYKQGAANKGTQDCVDRAKAADIPVRTFTA